MSASEASGKPRLAPSCPMCGKPRGEGYTPFCSKRCADIDLGRWLDGRYALPADDEDDGEGLSSRSSPSPDALH